MDDSKPIDISLANKLWLCTGCGYYARSYPYKDLGVKGTFTDICPKCGEQNWHWCGGDDKATRTAHVLRQ